MAKSSSAIWEGPSSPESQSKVGQGQIALNVHKLLLPSDASAVSLPMETPQWDPTRLTFDWEIAPIRI